MGFSASGAVPEYGLPASRPPVVNRKNANSHAARSDKIAALTISIEMIDDGWAVKQ